MSAPLPIFDRDTASIFFAPGYGLCMYEVARAYIDAKNGPCTVA